MYFSGMPHKLKTYILVAFAIFAEATVVLGQNIFQKRSNVEYIVFLEYSGVITSDTGFFVIGGGRSIDGDGNQTRLRNFFSWYDWQGELKKSKQFYIDNKSIYGMWYAFNPFYSNGFYHFGSLIDSLTNTQENSSDILIKRFDWNGDTVWTKRYDSGRQDLGYSCTPTIDGAIGISSTYINNNMCQRVIRFDSLGNIIWNRTYNVTASESYARYVKADSEGNFYITGWARPSGGPFQENARVRILKINGDGDIIWNKIMPGICDEYDCPIDIAQDGNLLLAKFDCNWQYGGNAIDAKIALYKLDKNNGDTLWRKEYPTSYNESTQQPYFLHQLTNGDILIGGKGLKLFYEDNEPIFGKYTGELILTDSNGNMKWQRYYFYDEGNPEIVFDNYITDGKETPDGGFILVGRTNSQTWQDGWIVKTDANGCIDMSCVNGVEELDDEDFRLFIYPNPANDYVSIDLPITHTKATLQIYSLQGALVKTEAINGGGLQNFSLTDLANGVYQLMVSASNGKLLGREKLVVVR